MFVYLFPCSFWNIYCNLTNEVSSHLSTDYKICDDILNKTWRPLERKNGILKKRNKKIVLNLSCLVSNERSQSHDIISAKQSNLNKENVKQLCKYRITNKNPKQFKLKLQFIHSLPFSLPPVRIMAGGTRPRLSISGENIVLHHTLYGTIISCRVF